MAYIDTLNSFAKDLYSQKDDNEKKKIQQELDAPLVLTQDNRSKIIGSSVNKDGKREYYFEDGSFTTAENESDAIKSRSNLISGSNKPQQRMTIPEMGVIGETSKDNIPPLKDFETESYLKKDVKESEDPYLSLINSMPKKKDSSWKDIIGDAINLVVPTAVGATHGEMATGAGVGADYTLGNIKSRQARENAYEDMLNKQAFELSKLRAKSKTS